MNRNIFIGDVHGCLIELKELITRLRLDPEDNVCFLGDLIHKGPDSSGVVKYVRELQFAVNLTVVTGNHEEKHLRWLRHEATGDNKMKHCKEYLNVQLDSADIKFLQNTQLAKRLGNQLAIHGGIPSAYKHDIPEGMTHHQWLQFSSKNRASLGTLLRHRYENPEGKSVALGKREAKDVFWADKYDGRFGIAIFGHQPFMQTKPVKFPFAYGIDLGCVHGGYLCALIEEAGAFTYVAVAGQMYQERISIYD